MTVVKSPSAVVIPPELRELPQWVVWRREQRDGKETKVPYRSTDPRRRASTTDSRTWSTFEAAREASTEADGIGFVFSELDPFCGVDLDDCLTGEQLDPAAAEVVDGLDSYTECSPSGTGVHVVVRAALTGSRNRTNKTPWNGALEVYDNKRFFCLTGEPVGRYPIVIAERQGQLDEIVERFLAKKPPEHEDGVIPVFVGGELDGDDELLAHARRARNGATFEALWGGDWAAYRSQSEADLALCGILAFWTGPDPGRLDRLFRRSGLMREKWDDRRGDSTYGADTIAKALEGKTAFYRESASDSKRNGTRMLPSPSEPMAVARRIAAEMFTDAETLTLRQWRGGWWRWHTSHWVEVEPSAIRALAYTFTEHAVYPDSDGELAAWNPTRHKIANLLEALAAVVHLSEAQQQPSWIGSRGPRVIVACANGLLDVEGRKLLKHTPTFFNQTAVPFDYEPTASTPSHWFEFLKQLWPDDEDSLSALQEWFGYVISGRLDLHKILLLVGPTRAGKGVIARVLGALIGSENVAGPTLTSLAGDFGLAPLIGKPLAVISDARLSGRNSHVVVERLLAISGEDTITVNRKYRDQWTGKLPARFMVISNELPHLGDASTAIAGRFVTVLLEHSFLGRENHSLEPALHTELPGILNWSLDGLARLNESEQFTRPASTDEAMIALQDLASPVAAFLRDCCTLDVVAAIDVDDLWSGWKLWALDNGHAPGTKQTFGRNLRAAAPTVRVTRPRDDNDRHRVYQGVTLRELTLLETEPEGLHCD